MIAGCCLAEAAGGADFHVSPQGNDADPGTLDKPFQTLSRAQLAARRVKAEHGGRLPDGGVTVWLRGGRYELENSFVLGPEDSGEKGRPMVYRAYPQESPLLSGGRIIRGWKRVGADAPGLPETAKGKVWVASLPRMKDNPWQFRELWADGKRLTRARWPNDRDMAFRVLDAITPPSGALKDAKTSAGTAPTWQDELTRAWRTVEIRTDLQEFPGGRLPSDLGDRNAELFTRNAGRWATMRIPVGKVDGTRMTMAAPLGCLSYYWGGMRLMSAAEGGGHIENALSLLDSAGEWYLDPKAALVYYLPGDGRDPNSQELVAPRLEQLVCIRGTAAQPVTFVELRGLRLEHAGWSLPEFGYRPALGCYYGTQLTPLVADVPVPAGSVRPKDEHPEYCLPAAVDLTHARDCLLELCHVGRVGASGIGLAEGCRGDRVVGCEVFDAGGHGIHAGLAHGPLCGEDFGWQSPSDEPQANEISNCHVHHTGQMDWGAYGIISSYCRGNRIAHNLVEQQPYSGICACFTWFAFPSGRDEEVTVEYNHVRHVVLKLFDAGGIYTKDRVAKSSVIRGNLIHDIGGSSHDNNGIFLDDRSAGFHLADNIVYGVGRPIRFNQTRPDLFTWGKNYFIGAGPDWQDYVKKNAQYFGELTNDYPRELAAKAGLEEPYKRLLLDGK
jgi:hypothetical protein